MEKLQKSAYRATVEEILRSYSTKEEGISPDEAKERLGTYGYNMLSERKKETPLKIFLYQLKNPLVVLLIIAGFISIFLSEFIDAGFIFAIVLINSIVGFVQEYKAENTINALKKLLSPKTLVIRSGVEKVIDSRELVPGDIVKINSGNAVPADMRLIDVQNLRVDESTITGESLPVEKNAHYINEETEIAEQHNMVFLGTTIVGGSATGVVVKTGNKTYLGTIAKQTSGAKQEKSPLVIKFSRFARRIGAIVVLSSLMIIYLEASKGATIGSMLKTVVGISVAAIPEGLPIVATIALSISVQRMGRKKAIIRQLPAAETLGSTTLIATDKTGTLTLNQMHVSKIFDGKNEHEKHARYDKSDKKLTDLLLCGVLCTEEPEIYNNKDIASQADPTESAVVNASQKSGIPSNEIEEWTHIEVLPFQNEKQMMGVFVEKGERKMIYVKGSPERILKITGEENNQKLLEKIEEYAKDGLRVIAAAEKKVHTNIKLTDEHLNSGFTFLGFFALIDPPREDVKEAIRDCHKSGIKVIMITGDHPTTASSIAKSLGLSDEKSTAITGQELSKMSDGRLKEELKKVRVFARVSPEQKLRIVNAYKEMGEIVAVTGDGVNDAPALRSAHIGIAMGKRGTDVAKEASQMVILDDSFSTIIQAVKEARVLFDNIRKATFFLIPTGFSFIFTIFTTTILGYPLPFTAVQLLWVNMVTNGLQDVSLAFEPGEKGVLSRPPRKQNEGIMSILLYRRSLLVAVIITIGTCFMYIRSIEAGASINEARTVALSTMIIFQFMQLFNARSERLSIFHNNFFSNKFLLLSMLLAIIAFALTITFAPLMWLLSTTPVSLSILIQITLLAITVIIAVEADKAITRKFHNPV
jgi:calcium-translocating P-type ATPase